MKKSYLQLLKMVLKHKTCSYEEHHSDKYDDWYVIFGEYWY